MYKVVGIVMLFLISALYGTRVESQIGINIGMNSTKNEGGFQFDNPTFGVTYQDNRYVVMPRVDVEYTKVNHDYATSLLKASINGVYEYENPNYYTTPYALAGLGYEYVGGATAEIFESHPFVQAGVGLRVDIEEGYSAKVEGKMLQVLGGSNEGNEAIVTAGMSFPLEYASSTIKRPKVVKKPKRVVVKRVVKPKIVYVINNECPRKINAPDLDRDGVEDRFDQCPATPCNFTVDSYGCPVKTTLQIHFPTNSSEIRGYSLQKIDIFAQFLLRNRGSFVHIVGHTDSRGSAASNLILSQERANAVVRALIQRGVSPARLKAEGRGESMPIASNATPSGRALNRRIEAVLSYPKGRR